MGDGPFSLPAGKPVALLRALLLNRNRVVSADALIDELWGEEPPNTATRALQGHVSQLRKALGADRLITKPPGYSLRVEEGELDLDRFELLVREGREQLAAGDAKAASRALESALGLWRGPAPGLEERRLAALEDRIESDLMLSRHSQLAAELEMLVAQHPLRERLRGQLMLALYRSGRQAESLDEYRRARETLSGARHRAERRTAGAPARDPAPRARAPGAPPACGRVRRRAGAALEVALDACGRCRGRFAGRSCGGARFRPRRRLVRRPRHERRAHVRRARGKPSRAVACGAARGVCALSGVVHCRLGPHAAIERLNRVQRNRQSLLQQVAALAVPADAGAGRSADLFQKAEQRSVAADWHYRDWLSKRTSCGRADPNPDLHAAWATDRAATRAKRQFVATFNPLARRFHRRSWNATKL